MKYIKHIFLLLVLYAFVQCKLQINNEFKIVNGVVFDQHGPRPGCNIYIKGTDRHITVDENGNFEVK